MEDARRMRIEAKLRDRERGFLLSQQSSRIPPYNALIDKNMCHYFENRNIQQHLMRTGQIDRTGRVLEMDKNKYKLNILYKEFQRAEEEEKKRQAEEEEMRYRIHRKRIAELEKSRKELLISKLKKEKDFTRTILQTLRPQTSAPSLRSQNTRSGGSL